jgi:hypothetical protein
MSQQLIGALLDKGWSYPVIALRAKIDENRLRDGNLGRREYDRLLHVAEVEARICVDDLEGEE